MAGRFTVGRYDFAAQLQGGGQSLLSSIEEVLVNGEYILGPAVAEFEDHFARYLGGGVRVITVNSGTDALVLALEAVGIGPGDEVITVANTFHGTVLAIRRAG